MAMEDRHVSMRVRRVLTDNGIAEALNDSEFEFSGDDSDEDPEFVPPELNHRANNHQISESSSSDEEENTLVPSAASPAFSSSSDIASTSSRPRSRGRGRSVSRRRGRGRGRGRDLSLSEDTPRPQSSPLSTRQIAIRNRQHNDGFQDTWTKDTLDSEVTELMQPAYIHKETKDWEWNQFYDQYIDDNILTTIVNCTNRTHILETGKSMELTLRELKIYIGITMIMSALQYPQIDMYWSEKWKVSIIAIAMTRNRFFFIRRRLKCVYDSEVTAEQKIQKIWKVQPLFNRILEGCHEQNRPKEMSIDEMIIPFTGKCPMRQYCPNKPNPVGLKVFVLATPQGVVCDMVIYQGDTTFPHLISQGFSLGEAAVLHLTRTLVPGHLLFFDRFFTSIKLCDELLRRGFHGTGTVIKNIVPKNCVLTEEKVFRKKARGSSEVKVREDGKLAITMWLDNKPVLMMSTCHCDQSHDECERWSKKDKRYERVRRPVVIKTYNQNMGGVDLTDRMLSVCPSRSRTKKWTIRVISHLFDLAVLRQYKMDLGTKLVLDNEGSDDEGEDDAYEEMEPKHKKRKILIKPIPSKECRTKAAAHLPEYGTKQSRCRRSGCAKKTTVFCKKCDIYLCFTPNRNCYSDFHQNLE
ncbi:unnamed protein product, partial [Brenthis ino]